MPAVSLLATFSQVDITNSVFKVAVPGIVSLCCGVLAC